MDVCGGGISLLNALSSSQFVLQFGYEFMWVMLRLGQCRLAMWFLHILKWLMVMYEWKSSTGDADHDLHPC